MPQASDFVLASCQASLFTPEAEVSSSRITSRLLPAWSDRFDGDPTVLPLPDGVPKEVPKVILQSKSNEWSTELASGRANFRWRHVPGTNVEGFSRVFEQLIPLLIEYRDFVDSRIGRLAAVATRFVPQENPGSYLASHFCREEWFRAPFNRPDGFELHAHKRYTLADFEVNSWVRNKTGHLSKGQRSAPIVVIEQDLNTLAEEQHDFDDGRIRQFYETAATELDVILRLYYP